jgi:hypothetical protein
MGFLDHGFVLLLLPKAASTTLALTLAPHASLDLRATPSMKHVGARAFERRMAARLEGMGHPRAGYEVVSMFREPVAWLESWWRYRAREALDARRPERSTAQVAFDVYARAYVAGDRAMPIPRGRPGRFVTVDGVIGVDRIFAVERPDVWQSWFSERLGRDLDFKRANMSTAPVSDELSSETRAALREYFAPEYDLWERLGSTGQLSGVRGIPLEVPERPGSSGPPTPT